MQVTQELTAAKTHVDVPAMEAAIKRAVVWLSTAAGLQAPGVAQASLPCCSPRQPCNKINES